MWVYPWVTLLPIQTQTWTWTHLLDAEGGGDVEADSGGKSTPNMDARCHCGCHHGYDRPKTALCMTEYSPS